MTSISAVSGSAYQSPLQRLQDELQSEVSSGAVDSSDQDALSSALTDIDSSIKADGTAGQSGGTRPSPDAVKSKLDDLINQEVSSGKLTSDQATELQGVFKAAFAQGPGGAQGAGGAHGHHGGGHGASTPAIGDPTSTDSTDSGSSTSSTDSVSDVLQQFLQSLQDSQQSSSSSSYDSTGSTGSSNNSSSFAALLIDYQS